VGETLPFFEIKLRFSFFTPFLLPDCLTSCLLVLPLPYPALFYTCRSLTDLSSIFRFPISFLFSSHFSLLPPSPPPLYVASNAPFNMTTSSSFPRALSTWLLSLIPGVMPLFLSPSFNRCTFLSVCFPSTSKTFDAFPLRNELFVSSPLASSQRPPQPSRFNVKRAIIIHPGFSPSLYLKMQEIGLPPQAFQVYLSNILVFPFMSLEAFPNPTPHAHIFSIPVLSNLRTRRAFFSF